jgi:endonuclease/exonuclease/phosphatase (EEP) superfamily protein YafD
VRPLLSHAGSASKTSRLRGLEGVASFLHGIVTAVVLVVGVGTLVGLLDRVSWVFELADVFRLQYFVVLVGAALAAVALRRARLAAVAVLLAAVNVVVLGLAVAAPATVTGGGATKGSLRLLVANVEAGNTDYAAVERLVAQTRPDVFGVIELTPAMARHLRAAFPRYRPRVLDARDDAYGIGVYTRLPLRSAKVAYFPADGPPTVVARLRVAGKLLAIVITHVRTPFAGSIHVRHLDALAAARSKLGERVVVCGDFNTPPWSGPLRRFAADSRLHDLYGRRAWAAYSWPTWGYLLRVPLDNCFVSNGVAVTRHRLGPNVGSDHRPLVVDIGVP